MTLKLLRVDVAAGSRDAVDDEVAAEAPLEITGRGDSVAVVLRTPGHDLELVRGWLHAELGAAGDAAALEQVAPDRVEVDLPAHGFSARTGAASAACGACGRASLDELTALCTPVVSDLRVSPRTIVELPTRLAAVQNIFHRTGGLHAAAIFDEGGALLVVREDVGRHNALDKAIGWAITQRGLPLARSIVMVSGRLGYELAQKAVMAGAPIIAAVSAPSSLALEVCQRFRVTACAFVRGERFNLYCHPERITT